MRTCRSILTLFAVLSLASCGTTQPRAGTPFEGGAGSQGFALTVENNNFRDATIYVYWNGLRTRAGSVIGKSTATFRMDWKSEWVHLRVDFLGGGGYDTEQVPVDPGDHLHFVIMATP